MPAIVLDHMHWAQLEQVQMQVNSTVAFKADQQRFGVVDYWEPAAQDGDCKGMSLAKRAKLVAMGWNPDDLRIAIVIDEKGELHAVLTVDVVSAKGAPATYVMDSRFTHVEPWKRLTDYGYTWVERAKPGSEQWAMLTDANAPAPRPLASLSATLTKAEAGSPVGVESQ
jgi:predicted transglutaminase-like cysteine proteinase